MMTIVVVTYESERVLGDCLSSVPDATIGSGPFRLVVVDNASSDRTLTIAVETLPDAIIVETGRNAGYAAGVNTGIAAAGGSDAVLLMNPDVRLQANAVRHLAEALKVPGTGIAVPRVVGADGQLTYSLRREPTVLRALGDAVLGGTRAGRFSGLGEVVTLPSRYETAHTEDWASGAVMMMSRSCLDAVGPWDESFFLYSEETDFALRARDAGFALRYVPDAVAVHLGGDSKTSPRLWSLLILNRARLFRRRHGAVRSALFRMALVLNEGLRAVPRRPTHRAALRALLTRNLGSEQ